MSFQESDSDDSEEERQTEAEKRKQRALMRIAKRKEESEKKLTLDDLRAPVVRSVYMMSLITMVIDREMAVLVV